MDEDQQRAYTAAKNAITGVLATLKSKGASEATIRQAVRWGAFNANLDLFRDGITNEIPKSEEVGW